MPSLIRNWGEMLNTLCECDSVRYRHQLLEEYHALNTLLRNRSDCEVLLKIVCVSWSDKPEITGWIIIFPDAPDIDNTIYWGESLKDTLMSYLRMHGPGSCSTHTDRWLALTEENSEMLALLQSMLLLLSEPKEVT